MPAPPDPLLVPAEVGTDRASILVAMPGATAPSAPVWVEHDHGGRRWDAGPWQSWLVPGEPARGLHHQRIRLDGLAPDTRHPLTLRVAGQARATAAVTTLPTALPRPGEAPFTILLGSCFCLAQDRSGSVGRTFARMGAARPRVKFLVGDQVYLDSPFYRFLLPQGEARLAAGFLDKYLQTWGQRGDLQGLNQLLGEGANYFCSDDHEFWNNAPYATPYAVDTYTRPGRERWLAHAGALYRAFQAPDTPARLDVGMLSAFVLDTRVHRRADRREFARPADLAALAAWVGALRAPGILVIGQPIFAKRRHELVGRVTDWNLPDFEQYGELCRILAASPQSLLVLTGDVHYGRIATATLPSGVELVEVISSPMALVDRSAGGSWHAAPGRFPDSPVPGVPRVPVVTDSTWARHANHFVTLECHDAGGGLGVRVRSWETAADGHEPAGTVVAERLLKRMAA